MANRITNDVSAKYVATGLKKNRNAMSKEELARDLLLSDEECDTDGLKEWATRVILSELNCKAKYLSEAERAEYFPGALKACSIKHDKDDDKRCNKVAREFMDMLHYQLTGRLQAKREVPEAKKVDEGVRQEKPEPFFFPL